MTFVNFLATIYLLLPLFGNSILQQTPWISSREVSCSWDDRGFLVDGKPFIFTQEETVTTSRQFPSRRRILAKDADNKDDDDETVDDIPSETSDDDVSKTIDDVVTSGDVPHVATVDNETHSSTHDDDGADDDNDNDDDKDDGEDADVEIILSSSDNDGTVSPSKQPKSSSSSSSSSRVHNNAAAIAEVKALWRDVINGAREGCLDLDSTAGSSTIASSSSSMVLSVVPGSVEGEREKTSHPTQLSTVSVQVKSSSVGNTGFDEALFALRANGTDRASFLRQVSPFFITNPTSQ